jgi:lysyl-tRNA synthetase class I
MEGDICWPCVNKAAEERRKKVEADIDRAMEWCEEYLREEEIFFERHQHDILSMSCITDDDMQDCIRYLEKVEGAI